MNHFQEKLYELNKFTYLINFSEKKGKKEVINVSQFLYVC